MTSIVKKHTLTTTNRCWVSGPQCRIAQIKKWVFVFGSPSVRASMHRTDDSLFITYGDVQLQRLQD